MRSHLTMLLRSLLIAGLVIGLTASTSSAAPQYSDLPEDHEAADAVAFLTERYLIKGFSDGTFRPDEPMTRGDASKLMVVASKYLDIQYPKGPTGKTRMLKVRDKETGKGRTISMAKAYPDRLIIRDRLIKVPFPKRHVTNAQFARMISETIQLPNTSVALPYTDLPNRSNYWYKQPLQNNVAAGILPNTKTPFNSHQAITRSEIAQQLTAAIQYHLNIEPDLDTPIDDSGETEKPSP